ncbi:hypothetical protein V491_07956 [Pseudogymnoascus sp. VKM F-3775]|nr:hypothetical protein V491_07956 [Pseudogymnoascus sp. VKM F-3775]
MEILLESSLIMSPLPIDFYDAFVAVSRGLFSTRSRADHTRKRKIVAHTFSAKSVMQFEQYMHQNLNELLRQWDIICQKAPAESKFARFDCLPWFAYLTFDTIGDLAFGAPFGMLKNGQDTIEYMDYPGGPSKYMRAVDALSRRGEAFAVLGCLPFLKKIGHLLPDSFLRNGVRSGSQVAGIAIARVNERLASTATKESERVDILARLMEGKDSNGQPLGRKELTAEALTQLIAGSDTTSNTLTGIFYWLLKHPEVLAKLQAEVDSVIFSPNDEVAFQTVKNLPYLRACMNEGMRIHSTSALGLPRVVPVDGPAVEICGRKFEPGTVLSVPNYTIHRLESIWGPDSSQYRPERWETLSDDQKKAFVPFGHGPRSCIGRNVAEMELTLAMATLVRRYDFVLYQEKFETWEGQSSEDVTESKDSQRCEEETESRQETDSGLDGGFRAWSVVFGAWCCHFCAFGWVNASGNFQEYYETHQLRHYSSSTISWILSLEPSVLFATGLVVGKYYQFVLAQGICSPLGASFIFYAGLSCTATWFKERRALAFGIVASGSSLGGIVFPTLLTRLLPTVGFGWSLRISGFLVLALLIIANIMVRSRIKPVPRPFSIKDYTDPFTEPTFVLLMLSVTCGFFAMFIPINYIVLEAVKNGIDAGLSGYLLAILNAGSLPGRILPGYYGDKLGRFNVMIAMCTFSALVLLVMWLPGTLIAPRSAAIYVVTSLLYGFASGAFVGMVPALLGQISPDITKIGSPIAGAILSRQHGTFWGLQVFAGVMMVASVVFLILARVSLVGFVLRVKV